MFSKIITKIEVSIIIISLIAMTLITFFQVIARYVFNSGAVWALELTTYLFAWMVLFGASYVVKQGAHITIEALVERCNPKLRKSLTLIAISACMIFVIMMFLGGLEYIDLLQTIEIEMQDLPILEWHGKIALPLGFLFIFYRLSELLFDVLKNKKISIHSHNIS